MKNRKLYIIVNNDNELFYLVLKYLIESIFLSVLTMCLSEILAAVKGSLGCGSRKNIPEQ